jgi:DNA polymerase III subunit epsilon
MLSLFGGKKKKPHTINEKQPITETSYVVVDTELTGLNEKKDDIVSIGAVRMTGGRIELGDVFYRLINPQTQLTANSVVIHEILPSEVRTKPGIDTVLAEFLDYSRDAVLVGHFISIDLEFLNREVKRLRGAGIPNPVLDTFSIYDWLRKRDKTRDCFASALGGYRLFDIVKCFGIPVNHAHNALMDAFTTAQLFQRFFPMLLETGTRDIGDLLKIGTPFEGGDQFGISGEFSNF